MTVLRFAHPVLLSRKLKRGPVPVTVAGQKFALFRDNQGRAAALRDQCPHRFAPLSAGRVRPDGRLACAYHGWNFDAEGRGRSPHQPSLTKCDALAMDTFERDGFVWLGERGASRAPSIVADGYTVAGAFAMPFAAPLFVALDNFSEDEHTPYVHTYLGWQERDSADVEFEAENGPDFSRVVYRAPQRPVPVARALGILPGDRFHNEWLTRFDPARIIYDIYWTDPKTGERRPHSMRVSVFFVPEGVPGPNSPSDRRTTLATLVCVRNDRPLLPPVELVLKKLALGLVWNEFRDDQKFVRHVKDTPFDLRGMRLGRFDKPIIHNHKLLERIYWGSGATTAPINQVDEASLAATSPTGPAPVAADDRAE